MRHAIREFTTSLAANLKHLLDYLQQVRKEQSIDEHFEQINQRAEFLAFKDIFLRNRWINYTPNKVEEFFNANFAKVKDSFGGTLDNVIKILEDKINSIKNLSKAG